MRYNARAALKAKKRRAPRRRRTLILLIILFVVLVGASVYVRRIYFENLKPVDTSVHQPQLVTIPQGASVDAIAAQLKKTGLIRSPWAFKLYVSSKEVRDALQAGTYSFDASQSVSQIVSQLTHGKIASNLVTILPGQRIDQIRSALLSYGFTQEDVDAAFNPVTYAGDPALVDKPAGVSLEGYLYPDSYQKTAGTTAQHIVRASLGEMQAHLTPGMRAAFATQGLSTYQAIILASMVGQEVSRPEDRAQVAQVFISRLHANMPLGSDPTAYYGVHLAGQPASLAYDSPYNTALHTGLPPTPISNVNASDLNAVAHPANTTWLYFVTGDDGTTHFSHTLDEHKAATAQYCHKLCAAQ